MPPAAFNVVVIAVSAILTVPELYPQAPGAP